MSWLVWVALAYLAGLVSAFIVFAVFHASGNRKAEEELEAKELAAMSFPNRRTAVLLRPRGPTDNNLSRT